MRGEQTENGENSTNSVSAKDDGTATNITSDMSDRGTNVNTNPVFCDAQTSTKNMQF